MDNRIVSIDIVDGELIVTYQDGTTQSLGPISEMDLEQLTAAVVKNAGDIVGLKRADTALQTSVAALETAVAAAETAIEGAEDDIDDLETEVSGLKNDLNQFPSGNYPQMGAGYANQLVSSLKKEDQTPYNFRKVPYDATLEEVKKVVGGTIVNNQLLPELKNNNGWAQYNYDTSYTWGNNEVTIIASTEGANGDIQYSDFRTIEGHKYFLHVPFCNASDSVPVYVRVGTSQNYPVNMVGTKDTYVTAEKVFVADASARLLFQGNNGTKFKELNLTDLTQDFGTTIADYVYNLEQATAGAGVAWLKTHFPKQFDAGYQAYDAGSLQSVSGLTAHKMVGFNAWDEEWENTYYNDSGVKTTNNDLIGSKNFIKVIPGATYYGRIPSPTSLTIAYFDSNKTFLFRTTGIVNETFTIPANCQYISISTSINYGGTYNHDICINLSDPTKNGTYEPYEAHSYALDSDVVLRGIPKVDANGKLYYDGDEYLPDGTVNRRWGIVDLGTLNWEANSGNAGQFYGALPTRATTVYDGSTCRSSKYASGNAYDRTSDKVICTNVGYAWIYDTSFSSATELKSNLSGAYLIYELETPTAETADPYTTPQIVSPNGTEEYIYTDGSFELPVGHSSDYPVDVSGQLDDILDTPSANGTYTLKATVTDGAVSYSWVADA